MPNLEADVENGGDADLCCSRATVDGGVFVDEHGEVAREKGKHAHQHGDEQVTPVESNNHKHKHTTSTC